MVDACGGKTATGYRKEVCKRLLHPLRDRENNMCLTKYKEIVLRRGESWRLNYRILSTFFGISGRFQLPISQCRHQLRGVSTQTGKRNIKKYPLMKTNNLIAHWQTLNSIMYSERCNTPVVISIPVKSRRGDEPTASACYNDELRSCRWQLLSATTWRWHPDLFLSIFYFSNNLPLTISPYVASCCRHSRCCCCCFVLFNALWITVYKQRLDDDE